MDYSINKDYPLTDEQNEILDFMRSRPQSINAAAPGLGKTLMTCTLAVHFMTKHPEYKCIILCPNKANKAFKRELEQKLHERVSLYTADYIDKQPNSRFFIFNHSSMDKFYDEMYRIRGNGGVFFIIDEAHNLENPTSAMYQTAKKILGLGKVRWALTATPLGNDLEGLYWLVELISPGFLGSFEWFRNRYEQVVLQPMRVRGQMRKIPQVVGYKNLDELNIIMKQICIIKKRSYKLNFIYKRFSIEPEVLKIYKMSAQGLTSERVNKKTGKTELAAREWGARLHDLQKCLDNCHPQLEGISFSNKERELCKLILEKFKVGEAVLIYCEYYDTIDRVTYVLNKLKYKLGIENIFHITGRQKNDERAKVEDNLGPRSVVIVSKAGCECFARGTEIIMADGSLKKIEDVRQGDFVMGYNSIPRRVLETHSNEGHLYRVIQSQAESYIVSENHILSLVCNRARSNYDGYTKGTRLDISVKDYLKKSKSFRESFSGFKRGYEGAEIDLPMDPYILGLWLGDGNAYHSQLCVSDLEIELGEQWKEYGKTIGLDTRITEGNSKNGRAKWYTLTSHINGKTNIFRKFLKDFNLSGNKHIPEIYFHASRKQRLQLLAGLINTDGNKHRESICISSNNERLIRDYKRLADSLGYHTAVHSYKGISYGKEFINSRVSIVGQFEDLNPMLLEKKRPEVRKNFKDFSLSNIKIEPVEDGEYFGFSIEGNDKLFMLRDGTIVHNSINLQKSNNVIFYDVPFSINDVIQMVGRVARMDSKFPEMNIYFLEYEDTLDTYKCKLIQAHSTLIDSVLCHDTNLPTEVLVLDNKSLKDMKMQLVWKFRKKSSK